MSLKTPDLPYRVAQLRLPDLLWLMRGAVWLMRARLVLWWYPVSDILHALQQANPGSAFDSTLAARVCWAIRGAARVLPFRTDCLVRVIAAHAVLCRNGVSTSFHLQAGTDDERFQAHAWLESSGIAVAGGPHPGIVTLTSLDRTEVA